MLRRARGAFTLIELLTVIAIIGILAAIIIPTVSKVRQSARNAQCVSQLREWGRIIHLFANDNKGNYYAQNWASVADSDAPMGRSYKAYYTKANVEGFRMRYCPSDPETPTLLGSANNPRYAMVRGSINYPGVTTPSESTSRPPAIPLGRATSASNYILMMDSLNWSVGVINGVNDLANLNTYIAPLATAANAPRHGGRNFNAVFGDGSVKSVSFSTTDLNDRTNVFMKRDTWLRLN